ncbi:MAG: hypothetical protein IKT04_01285, partial [Clostridia bacterium]|nr:hypothetical protein [Clostridia bacterium]
MTRETKTNKAETNKTEALKKERIDKKQYILRILDILRECSDEITPMSTKEIMEILENKYELSVDRKTVQANIKTLIAMDYPIKYKETIPRSTGEIQKGV